MINTKDVFHTPRQQAHCTRASHIESDPTPDDRLHAVALEQIWNDFRVNLAFEILRTIVLPERPTSFSFNPRAPKKLLLISIFPEKGD